MPSRLNLLRQRAFDVAPMVRELDAHPQVWNTIKLRTEHPQSPHREVDDVWVHYNPIENYRGDMQAFNAEHVPAWYPVAELLPSIKACAESLARRLGGILGFVLITRIPPGKQVYPHIDQGWHARTHAKFCVCIKANLSQAFCFEGEELRSEDGDLFTFDNAYPHHVTNESDTDRISLIVCLRGLPMRESL